jgi:phosphate transport system protein
MQHTSKQFEYEMDTLRERVLEMGALSSSQLSRIYSALSSAAITLAEEIAETERSINEAHSEIDALCTRIVAKRQPAAADLRYVLATIHVIGDIERIGDETKKILSKLADPVIRDVLTKIPEVISMAALTNDMMRRAMAALARQDALSALDTLRMDTKVDADYSAAIERLTRLVANNVELANPFIECAFIARSLERCGDHVKNVAEEVVSIVRGEDVRHRHGDAIQ